MKLLVLALLLVVTTIGCHRDGTTGQASENSVASAKEPPYFKTHYQDESQFIVESIVTDIAEMAYFAKTHEVPKDIAVEAVEEADSPVDAPVYKLGINLSGKTIHSELRINRPIWEPEGYVEVGRSILKSLNLSPKGSRGKIYSNTDLAESLLQLTGENIERENNKLSVALEENFTDINLHEGAALLVGAFAFREQDGVFNDVRAQLSRMTAHLCMARILGSGEDYGVNGKVAEAILYTLMENEVDGASKAVSLNTNQPEIAAWSRALYARNTKDYRALAAIPGRSLAETFEYFRACCACLYPEAAWEELPNNLKNNYTDPYRILANSEESIELGHVLLEKSVGQELKEWNQVYRLAPRPYATNATLAEILNARPERCFSTNEQGIGKVRVIGWGQWAMYFQRHICNSVVDNFNFLKNRWGVPEDAAEYDEKTTKVISGLTLFPFVRRFNCTDEGSYKASIDLCYPASQATPELFCAHAWNHICFAVKFAEFYQPFPNPHLIEWFKHNPPPGTAYDSGPRTEQPDILDRPDAIQHLDWLHDKAPYSWTIVDTLLHIKFHDAASFEQEEPLLRPVLDYDANSMSTLASKLENNPAAYEDLMLKAAQHTPSAYLYLGHYVAGRGEDEKAMRYLEKGMDFDKDAVRASSYSGELIRLYLKHGQKTKASDLADEAAAVYSSDGFKAKADFLEAQGRYTDALKCYDEIEGRYGPDKETMRFLLRVKAKTGKKDFDQAIAQHVAMLFPDGVEKVALSAFTQPPTDGVLITEENAETARAGLTQGTVIVATQGIRVHNFDQFTYARDSLANPELELILWQDKKYRQITAKPPDRRFGVHMPNYRPK